jgi:hypothetical protein
VLEEQPTADCKVEKNYYCYLATIIQKNLFHFPKPLRIVVLLLAILLSPIWFIQQKFRQLELFHRLLFSFNLSMFLMVSHINLSKSFKNTPFLFYKKNQIRDHFCLNMAHVLSKESKRYIALYQHWKALHDASYFFDAEHFVTEFFSLLKFILLFSLMYNLHCSMYETGRYIALYRSWELSWLLPSHIFPIFCRKKKKIRKNSCRRREDYISRTWSFLSHFRACIFCTHT